jgi:ArsR family transcriptional regulator, arsenate/arsenite/antimonite-responsive transcriptional repressor
MVMTMEIAQRDIQLGALADPTRLAILGLLRERDHCVCHLIERLGVKQSVLSHHVGILRRTGFITAHPHAGDRRWVYYRLDRSALRALSDSLAWLADAAAYDPTPLPCPADATDTAG